MSVNLPASNIKMHIIHSIASEMQLLLMQLLGDCTRKSERPAKIYLHKKWVLLYINSQHHAGLRLFSLPNWPSHQVTGQAKSQLLARQHGCCTHLLLYEELLLMQITDAGAQMLLDSLAMDRSLIMLDLSYNQVTAKRCALCSVW